VSRAASVVRGVAFGEMACEIAWKHGPDILCIMRLPVPILKRPGLGALGAASDPVASNTMAEVPRRKAPSVEIGDVRDVRDITSPLHSRACWNEAAGSVGAQKTRPKMTENASRSIVAASTTDLAEVGMNDGRI
jgi:hypothetical protein